MAADIPKRPRCPSHWTIAQRLDYYVDRSGGPDACWPWTGCLNANGYGGIKVDGGAQLVHRVAWIVANGPIPDGHGVLHRCDNPACINPAHLWTDTHAANMADRDAKRRGGDLRGIHNGRAKLTEKDVLTIRGVYGRATVNEIARRFGLNRSAVYKILSGKRWKHLA
jgi:hypothetical protein